MTKYCQKMDLVKLKTDLELRDNLNQVVRLRLFRNTNEELSQYIGYNSLRSNNSIKNLAPFMARCIFRELCKEVQEKIDPVLDLENILKDYATCSIFYDKYIKGKRVATEDNIYILLNCYYVDDYELPSEKVYLKNLLSMIYEQQIYMPILLLLMLGVLPLYTSKKGDVKNIMHDFKITHLFLKKFVANGEIQYELSILDRIEKEVHRDVYCSRLYLINITATILSTYSCFANPQELYALNAEIKKEKTLLFDIEDTFWVEHEMLLTPSVFWVFKLMDTKDYFLYR